MLVEYTLMINGEVIETNVGKYPLEYRAGAGQVVKGLARILDGMSEGEERTVTIEPRDAYGKHYEDAYKTFPKSSFPPGHDLKKGMVVELKTKEGKSVPGVIWQTTGDEIVINFNHPLAGKTLTFQLRIVKIVDP